MKKIKFADKKLILAYTEKKDGNMSFNRGILTEVKKNRRKVAESLGIISDQLYEGEQNHHANIILVSKENIKKHSFPKTDGLITDIADIFLIIKVGDCFPVIFYDPIKKVVANIHVGNFGAAEKIFLEALLKMVLKFKSRPKDINVWIGPGARKCCYWHKTFYHEKLPEWQEYIKKIKDKKFLDIPKFISHKLMSFGILANNIKDSGLCTICSKDLFSHYRSKITGEKDGRMAVIAGIKR